MWQFEMNGVFIQVVPQWMERILCLPEGRTPRLHSGEFLVIGDRSNRDLLRAAGFEKEGAVFDYAVPLGDPNYGPHAFTFYKHPDPEYADIHEGTSMKYAEVLWRMKVKVMDYMRGPFADVVFTAGPRPNQVFPIE